MAVVNKLKDLSWLVIWEIDADMKNNMDIGPICTTFMCQDVTYKMSFKKCFSHLELNFYVTKGSIIYKYFKIK